MLRPAVRAARTSSLETEPSVDTRAVAAYGSVGGPDDPNYGPLTSDGNPRGQDPVSYGPLIGIGRLVGRAPLERDSDTARPVRMRGPGTDPRRGHLLATSRKARRIDPSRHRPADSDKPDKGRNKGRKVKAN